jgi:hypothetical protein
VKELKVLKTTQSGYEGYLKDEYTLLGETRDRIMATSVTATWKVGGHPMMWWCNETSGNPYCGIILEWMSVMRKCHQQTAAVEVWAGPQPGRTPG